VGRPEGWAPPGGVGMEVTGASDGRLEGLNVGAGDGFDVG
jgi:hypothetical protein